MANSAAKLPPAKRVSIEEYFRLDDASPDKLEYDDGEIFNQTKGLPGAVDMAGGTTIHSRICANLMRELGTHLFEKSCEPFGSDQRVSVPDLPAFSYPDVTVVCGEVKYDPREPDQRTVINPKLIIEVLSPSTEKDDRGRKFQRYIKLETLYEYVLVSQKSARVEIFSRRDDGAWLFSYADGIDAVAELISLNIKIPLKLVYHKVDFTSLNALTESDL